jgi:crotonobetainyl-CoA:carnitine CoA-transferase CaiB-like acyl-CoA transferase
VRGIRVVELSSSLAGAYCARLLLEAGAEVVAIEPPEGSPLRAAPPFLPASGDDAARSALHEYVNAGKRSAVLAPDDDHLDALLATADLVISSCDGAPETARALDRRVKAANAAAVHTVFSGFGLTGPWAGWRRSALTDWAAGGHLYLTGDPAREPLQGGGPWDSYLTGATGAVGAQAALIEAARTGRGQLVDVSAMEATAAAHQWTIVMYTHTGVVKRRWGMRMGEAHHPLSVYQCAEGWISINAPSRDQWENLCIVIDAVHLLADDRLYAQGERFDRADEIDAYINAWLSSRTAAEAEQELQANRVPAARALDMEQLLGEPQLAARQVWAERPDLGEAARHPARAFELGRGGIRDAAPKLGADTAGVLAQLEGPAELEGRPEGRRPASPPVKLSLRGVRVLEFSVAWSGPLAGRYLADLGADVLKVEHPTSRGLGVTAPTSPRPPWQWGTLPDPLIRSAVYPDADPGERWWNRMGLFNKLNRGKKSLSLDAKTGEGAGILRSLIAQADVVLHNYTPRGARSLGIDHPSLVAINPRIVSVAMSGFGETGPLAAYSSFGPILEAQAGFVQATGYEGEGPCRLGLAYPDAVGGVHGATAILGGLWEREVTGRDVHVDLSQLETLVAIAGEAYLHASVTGVPPVRRGNRSEQHAPQGVFRSAGEDEWLAITVDSDESWSRLVEAVGAPELADRLFATVEGRRVSVDKIDRALSGWTTNLDKFAAAEQLQRAGVIACPVMTNKDLVESEHLAERGFIVTWDQPDVGPRTFGGFPLHFDDYEVQLGVAPPLGEHNAEVLCGQLGYSPHDVDRLLTEGVIADRPPS